MGTPDETAAGPNKPGKEGRIVRFLGWLRRPAPAIALGTIVAGGFAAGIIFWGGFNWAMELTNTEAFCISCHEMKSNVYAEYRRTSHYANRSGVRASCPDCHVPKEWHHKIWRKIQASNELYHHFFGSVSTSEKFSEKRLWLATNEWRRMKSTDSRECRNCHKFDYMDYSVQEPRASKIHQEGLGAGKTCIDCHRGIVHTLPPHAPEAYKKVLESLESGNRKSLNDYLQAAAPLK